jgi:hypothetical protein
MRTVDLVRIHTATAVTNIFTIQRSYSTDDKYQ